jgi:hypothetical protein
MDCNAEISVLYVPTASKHHLLGEVWLQGTHARGGMGGRRIILEATACICYEISSIAIQKGMMSYETYP